MKLVISSSNSVLILLIFQHFIELPDRTLHDGFSENDIKVNFVSLMIIMFE